jgi:hypothetical protein
MPQRVAFSGTGLKRREHDTNGYDYNDIGMLDCDGKAVSGDNNERSKRRDVRSCEMGRARRPKS